MGGVCVKASAEDPPVKSNSELSKSSKQHELPIHLLPPEPFNKAATATKPKRRSAQIADLYKNCKLEFVDQLKAIGAYPVVDVWNIFKQGEILGKGGYGEVTVVQKKPISEIDIWQIANCEDKFAMKTIPQIRKGKISFFERDGE
jgi:hypothetical protein